MLTLKLSYGFDDAFSLPLINTWPMFLTWFHGAWPMFAHGLVCTGNLVLMSFCRCEPCWFCSIRVHGILF